jgi:hypothetical protein
LLINAIEKNVSVDDIIKEIVLTTTLNILLNGRGYIFLVLRNEPNLCERRKREEMPFSVYFLCRGRALQPVSAKLCTIMIECSRIDIPYIISTGRSDNSQ